MSKTRTTPKPPADPNDPHQTGVVTAQTGRQYQVYGWNFETNKGYVANDRGETQEMTNYQIGRL